MKTISNHTLKKSHGGDILDNIGSGFISFHVGALIGLIFNKNFLEEYKREKACHAQGFVDGLDKSQSDQQCYLK